MPPRRTATRPTPKARRSELALAGAVLLVSLVVGESVMRAFVRPPLPRVLPEVSYEPHPVRRFTLAPDQRAYTYGAPVRIDDRAFRVTGDHPVGNGDRADVLALGDSFTFGMGVGDEETWPARLQQQLSRLLGRSVAVVNAGTISYGVFQEMDLLRSAGLATRPRVVIHALYWNDFMNAGPPAADEPPVVDGNGYLTWDGLGEPRGYVRRVASSAITSSALLFTLRQAAAASLGASDGPTRYGAAYQRMLETGLTASEWRPVEEFYVELRRLSREHDFAPMVVIMPVSGIVEGPGAPADHPYPAAARELLSRLGIPYVDTFRLWRERSNAADHFLPQGADAHLNAAGYRLVADALARALVADSVVLARLRSRDDAHTTIARSPGR